VIATPGHCKAIVEELARRLIDVEQAKRIGDLVCLDAEETLATFMDGQMPHPGAFRTNVGRVIEQALGGRTRTAVRAYGEMVDVLWKKGRADAAIKLEILWNELAQTHAFQLLCGYSIGNFYKQTKYFEEVCRQHNHVEADTKVATFERRNIPRTG
jgi:MEDS: MEthanogen/methylotroph, DcmR Sensory domain